MTKVCSRCERELPATKEYFFANHTCKLGLDAACKDCIRLYREKNKEHISEQRKIYRQTHQQQLKQYRADNKEKKAAYGKEYREKNKEQLSQKSRQYRDKNKAKIAEQDSLYYQNNKERLTEYAKQYRIENKECINEYHRQYRKDHKERISRYLKIYFQEHKEEMKEERTEYAKWWNAENTALKRLYSQQRRSRKRQLPATLTAEQWETIKTYFSNKCAYCGSLDELAQDHFVPLLKGGEYTHNNIVPACKSCNSSKGSKDFFEWYAEQNFYTKKKERQILEFLGYNSKTQTQQLSIGIIKK